MIDSRAGIDLCYTAPASVVARAVGGEIVLLDLSSGTYYSLTGVAAHIWRLVERGSRLDQIVEAIARDFDADPARVADDARRFLTDAESAGLVRAA